MVKQVCKLIGLCALVGLLASPALGEFYKYRDRSGVLRFTDNLADVPLDQRPDAKSYKEADDYLTPAQKEERAKKVRMDAEMEAKQTQESTFEVWQETRMSLNKTRMELDTEYGELMREKEKLAQDKTVAASPEEQTTYKKRVNALNRRIIEYETRRNQYEENITKFNEQTRKAQ